VHLLDCDDRVAQLRQQMLTEQRIESASERIKATLELEISLGQLNDLRLHFLHVRLHALRQ
jgi:hypothetical protein